MWGTVDSSVGTVTVLLAGQLNNCALWISVGA